MTTKATAAPTIRDRIIEFRRVPSGELTGNDANWRVHPFAQRAAIAELLSDVGIAGVLTAYYSQRNDGKLTLIDGHERSSEHDTDWPTIILDVSDEEADKLLLALDPIAALADLDGNRLDDLLSEVEFGTPALVDLAQTLAGEALEGLEELGEAGEAGDDEGRILPEMELQPFEHYDYVVLICRNTYDWMALQDKLGIEPVQFTVPNARKPRVGMGRVIDARKLLDRLT